MFINTIHLVTRVATFTLIFATAVALLGLACFAVLGLAKLVRRAVR